MQSTSNWGQSNVSLGCAAWKLQNSRQKLANKGSKPWYLGLLTFLWSVNFSCLTVMFDIKYNCLLMYYSIPFKMPTKPDKEHTLFLSVLMMEYLIRMRVVAIYHDFADTFSIYCSLRNCDVAEPKSFSSAQCKLT